MAAEDDSANTIEWFVQAIGEDVPFAAQCSAEARALLAAFMGATEEKPNPYSIPAEVLDRITLEVGADLYYRKAARNGIVGFEGMDPTPMRLNRDPMAAAYPLLRRYIPVGL